MHSFLSMGRYPRRFYCTLTLFTKWCVLVNAFKGLFFPCRPHWIWISTAFNVKKCLKFPIFEGWVVIFCGPYGNFAKSENQAVITMPMCDTPEQTTLSGVFVNIRSIRVDDLSVILVCSEINWCILYTSARFARTIALLPNLGAAMLQFRSPNT